VSRSPLAVLELEAACCVRCRLAETRTKVVFGVGNPNADLLFVGEAPGAEEDLTGEPFVGRSGRLLDSLVFEELGMTRAEFYIANVVKCRPPGNRNPLPDEVELCHPYLMSQVALIAPKVTITLGNFAAQALLGTKDGVTKLRGKVYPFAHGVVVPTFHPAYALRGGGTVVAQIRADLVRAKSVIFPGEA
jgi:uracil-DNA glycosylase family 4